MDVDTFERLHYRNNNKELYLFKLCKDKQKAVSGSNHMGCVKMRHFEIYN